MIDTPLKFFLIILIAINIYINIKDNKLNKNVLNISEEKIITIKSDKYKELLKLYFDNRKQFYAKGREYKTNKKYNETNVLTFQEKLNYLLIYESPEDKTNIVDKILLRNYSESVIGKDLCAPIIKIYDDIDDINLDELPEKFVLKCNHGSGMNLFCANKSKFNLTNAKKILREWMDVNYGLLMFEYQYLNVKKKVFVEQFLEDEIINYKFSCFNGEPKFIRVKGHINGTNLYNIYNINWTISNIELDEKNYVLTDIFKKPINFEMMIHYARLLSSKFCYCRVDFYEVKGILYLSEITFTPFNSQFKFKTKEMAIYLGNLINISKLTIN